MGSLLSDIDCSYSTISYQKSFPFAPLKLIREGVMNLAS
jgi:hypothetical protein